MRMVRNVLIGLALGSVAVTQSGCLVAAAAVGTGATVAYVRGDLETTVDASAKETCDATLAAAKDLDLAITTQQIDGLGGEILTRTTTDTKLKIVVKSESEHVSKVTIRAGTFGDSALQQRMLDQIKTHLPTPATTTAATKPVAAAAS